MDGLVQIDNSNSLSIHGVLVTCCLLSSTLGVAVLICAMEMLRLREVKSLASVTQPVNDTDGICTPLPLLPNQDL